MIRSVDASTLPAGDKRDFKTFVDSNELRQVAYEGKTVREVINAERAFEVGKRLEAQDRESDAVRRAAMAKLISLEITHISDRERGVELLVRAQNRTGKPIRGFDAGLEVDDAKSHRRIGLAELHVTQPLRPRAMRTFLYPMRYVRFGEDTGSMRLSAGWPKVAHLDVFGVSFAGSEAPDDD